MKAILGKSAIVIVILVLGLATAYLARGIGAPGISWQVGDWWTVQVRRAKVFMAEPAPPWTEANRIRFEVMDVTRGVEGPQVQVLVNFDRPVMGGYKKLELTYDAKTAAPMTGRLLGDGLSEVDWATARALLEASLIPLDGMTWRQATAEQATFHVARLDRDIRAYRVVRDRVEYGWAAGVPWWLWYAAADQVRADLIDCSCWQPGAATQPGAPPSLAPVTPPSTPVAPAVYVVNYHLALKDEKAGASTGVVTRAGELVFDDKLGTQVISLSWGDPERRMHLYVSFVPGTSPQVALQKVVTTMPVYSVQPQTATALLVDGRASLEVQITVGKTPHLLNFDFVLRDYPKSGWDGSSTAVPSGFSDRH